jgi:hypothetical protein
VAEEPAARRADRTLLGRDGKGNLVIDAGTLLTDLQGELSRLVADLNTRVREDTDVRTHLEAEWRSAFEANRTGRTFEVWADDRLTQVAVAWLLACVFVRFCEDNGLIDEARIAGSGVRGAEARDAQQSYFAAHPHSNDREYLQSIFRAAAMLRGLDGVVGEGESPLWLVDPPADAATRLLDLFRSTDESGGLIRDFTDPKMDTRFLGDLYQDLSDLARDTYALLQTPEFVEEFILDRTLTPAIETFGLAKTTLIDPTCGSGHFLLGGFHRLFEAWRAAEPGGSEREHAERALAAVTGVDLNPFAAAIARFRLLVAALKASHVSRLADVPAFEIDVAVGDSLLWGPRPGQFARMEVATAAADRQFLYRTEHAEALQRVFDRKYTAVVGNPPYIVCRDQALNQQYRDRFESCHRKYSLGVPFTEKFFDLATPPDSMGRPAGFVGMITTNSFMKREFGTKLIEQFIPKIDLTHVIDTSGAYIPGHGTPTVILFGRHQSPVSPTIRTVMGIRGEPSTPPDPARGLVWSAIVNQIDEPGSVSAYVSVADSSRSRFAKHPWSIGGGGAAELKDTLDAVGGGVLRGIASSIGFGGISGANEVMWAARSADMTRRGVESIAHRQVVTGDRVRDWGFGSLIETLFPYRHDLIDISEIPGFERWVWPFRTLLGNRPTFSRLTYFQEGRPWWEWHQVALDRMRTPLSIAFSSVATNNHFVLDREGKLFNSSSPVIKLVDQCGVEDHMSLLSLLNSSLACFWMQQVFHNKGGPGGGSSKDEKWHDFYDVDGTKLQQFPLPPKMPSPDVGARLDALAAELVGHQPTSVCAKDTPTRERLDVARAESERGFREMVAAQEELDWLCLHLYGLTEDSLTVADGETPPPLSLGERAFEIVLARQVEAGQLETEWFARSGATPVAEIPTKWPAWYQGIVQRRVDLILRDRNVALVERPECKRRWAREPWEKVEAEALESWLLDRLENRRLWFEGSGDGERAVCRSVAQLADIMVAADPDFLEVARLWKGVVEVDPVAVVWALVAEEHVPAQAAARYTGKGLDKRRQWERTWELQRMEDRGDPLPGALERIPVPPRYVQADFVKPSFWKQRGRVDVPKERFVSVAGAERDADPTIVLAWAGFDHAELAQAIGTLLMERQQNDGWDADRSWQLVVAVSELLPWLAQWHADVDSRLGDSPAGLYRAFTEQQALAGERTLADVPDWRPAVLTRGRKKKDNA